MSTTICAFNHAEWRKYHLADYGDFAECVTDCNQEEWNDHTTGEWFYAPDAPPESCDRVIYSGSWGSYNAPGASSYTYAELYDMLDADDIEQYTKDLARWEACPEWLTEFCDECGDDTSDDTSDEAPNGWTTADTGHD